MKTHNLIRLVLMATLLAACKSPATGPMDPISLLYDRSQKPFYHGVASGDPLPDRVIIWTRVTPDDSASSISVKWEISNDSGFQSILKTDSLSTNPARDYTIKVDVDG
jgi:alkaline phosphatase D